MNIRSSLNVKIREAVSSDFEFVVTQMEDALSPYYNGDHKAHAERIFYTHIKGGIDEMGYFSRAQIMFIAEVNGKQVGIIHLVDKKQGTFKISPIIVARGFRGKYGIGNLLIDFAEEYAQKAQAREIYCTVAEQNTGALQFFLKEGYIVAGKSENHYKTGITEVMLYKLFLDYALQMELDQPHISVIPFNEKVHEEQVTNLMLKFLPNHFRGIDKEWIGALYSGYRRRETKDINVKYKLIFVATDQQKKGYNVIGLAVATPKKGQPIKIMPLIAQTPEAFVALVTDIPQLLQGYGHKFYTHIVPDVNQVLAFQRQGWTLDGVLPGAYHDKHTTQQWSYSYGDRFMRKIRMKKRFFDLVIKGKKKLEVRVGYRHIKTIQIGELINLSTHNESQIIKIKDVRIYSSIKEMTERENVGFIVHGMNKEEIFRLLKEIYPPHKEKLGVYVFEIECVK